MHPTNFIYLRASGLVYDGTMKSRIRAYIIIVSLFSQVFSFITGLILEGNTLRAIDIVETIHFTSHLQSGSMFAILLYFNSERFKKIDDQVLTGIYHYPWGQWEEEIEIRAASQRRIKRLTRQVVVVSLLGFWPMMFKNFILKPDVTYPLIIIAWIPFNVNSLPTFLLAYIYQLCGCLLCLMAWFSIITLLIENGEHFVSHTKILNSALKNMIKLGGKNELKSAIKYCVTHHQTTIQYLNEFQNSMSYIMLWIGVNSAIILCTMFFLLMDSRVTSLEKIPLLLMLPVESVYPFIFCWYGQRIYDESEYTRDAIYDMEWYTLPPHQRKDFVIIMIRCQKPMTISGGGLMKLSLAAFQEILTTSYSYLNMISAVN